MAETLTPEQQDLLPERLITVRKRRFRLTVHKRDGHTFRVEHQCRIAIGAPGNSTPSGIYAVHRKESPPTYTAPNTGWAQASGYTPGVKLESDDPANPLRGAFLFLDDSGVGIHGTANLLSLGTKASHGCVRVSEEDALLLYERCALGTPVVVS